MSMLELLFDLILGLGGPDLETINGGDGTVTVMDDPIGPPPPR